MSPPLGKETVRRPGFATHRPWEELLLARLVRYVADRERALVLPSLSEPTPLLVTSEEARSDLDLTDDEVARAWALLSTFETRLWSGGGGPESWTLHIDVEEARRYRDVETADDYLAARAALDRPPDEPFHPQLPITEAPELAPMLGRSSGAPAPSTACAASHVDGNCSAR